jgi:hypothetical protein
MNATSILTDIVEAMHRLRLEGVLIGLAAAALQGAPVTTKDFDFLIRATPRNIEKVKAFARECGTAVTMPYEAVSSMRRVARKPSLQVDFLTVAHGLRSYEGVKARASRLRVGGATLFVASLDDIIKSKRAANRPKDRAVLHVLEATREEEAKKAHKG